MPGSSSWMPYAPQGVKGFDDDLIHSVIKHVFKKGDKNSMSNYRPISLLTIFSKIFDKVINIC